MVVAVRVGILIAVSLLLAEHAQLFEILAIHLSGDCQILVVVIVVRRRVVVPPPRRPAPRPRRPPPPAPSPSSTGETPAVFAQAASTNANAHPVMQERTARRESVGETARLSQRIGPPTSVAGE